MAKVSRADKPQQGSRPAPRPRRLAADAWACPAHRLTHLARSLRAITLGDGGSEFLPISPAGELRAAEAAITKNMQAMQGA